MQISHSNNPVLVVFGTILFGEAAAAAAPDGGLDAWLKGMMYVMGVVVAALVVWEKVKAFRDGARKDGDEWVKKADHDKLADYVHTSVHDLRDKLNATALKLEVVKVQQDGLQGRLDQIIIANNDQTKQIARLLTLTELRIDRDKERAMRHGSDEESGN